jgi:hypothetical protein
VCVKSVTAAGGSMTSSVQAMEATRVGVRLRSRSEHQAGGSSCSSVVEETRLATLKPAPMKELHDRLSGLVRNRGL